MKTLSEMTADERKHFLLNASEVAYIEVDEEIENRLALLEPRKFNENSIAYDDCDEDFDEFNHEDWQASRKKMLELIQ
jgi:hypothetical protein